MSNLQIDLLGSPHLTLDDKPIPINTARAIPLLAFLAITGKSQPREVLANLLWPESTQKQALAALRTTLWRIKAARLDEWVMLSRNEIGLNYQKNISIDVVNFKRLLDKCNTHGHPQSQICLYCTPVLTEAVELYRGEFMAGFDISKAPTFDDWRMEQSVSLQILHLSALERLVKCHRTFGDFNLAIHYARIWINYDHINEDAHYQLMQLYSITGQRTAGITLYKHYKDVLHRELGIEPSEDITTLYKQILAGQSNPLPDLKVANPVFLIADIENARQYWANIDAEKESILSLYIDVYRDTARRFGGRILQKSDQSITLLFENEQPLHCAVTIHLKTRKVDWGKFGPPNIRMVLYSTIVEGEKSNNFALLTRNASALLAVSFGGQILFTDQTFPLLDLPSGSQVKDLGFLYIKEIEDTLHVYELIHPNLPYTDHPQLHSRSQQLVNFPILSPPFIGREAELKKLTQLISVPETRILTLVGPGGVGKTRLAVQLATQVAENFPDRVYFINLASLQDPEFIIILLAEVLKFSFYGSNNHAEQLGKYLHRMKALLVFDNFEHLRNEGALLLASLIRQTHFLKILITTRERSNMIAETTMEVRGMAVPETTTDENAESYSSVKLFLHNAYNVYPGFSYLENREAIITICQLVNGIPLGILLASTWVKVFHCHEIATEIQKNIYFLSTSAPDLDPRHRSLVAVFDNSWRLLSPEEQNLLKKLSIFRTGFSVEAANEICNASPFLLAVLSDKSLLSRQQDGRYEMLSTFNQYASAKLATSKLEFEATKVSYCNYYVNYCNQKHKELNSSQQINALADMNSELENIRIAWNLLVDSENWNQIMMMKEFLLAYHVMIGNPFQGRELFRSAFLKLKKLNNPDLELIQAVMQQLTHWMMIKTGFIAEGLQGLTESMEVFRSHNSLWDVAMTLMFLADVNLTIGDAHMAKKHVEEALVILHGNFITKSPYTTAISANCQSLLGSIYMELGDVTQARLNMDLSLAIHNQLGTYYGTIHPLRGLGKLAFYQGEFLQAGDRFLQALEIAVKINDRRGMAFLHNNLSAVFEALVNISESYNHLYVALKLSRETGDRRLTAVFLNNMAYHQLRYLHQTTEAIRTYHEAITLFSEVSDLRGVAFTYYDMSKAYLKVGLVEEAWNYCLRSLNTSMTLDSISMILHSLHGFANFYTATNELERALRLCYLLINHPNIEPDTRNRAIVTRAEIEANSPPEIIQSAQTWGDTVSLQDVLDQVLAEKHR
jgi:DNA-binding SARP family transcriptional activator/predicted ATPase